MSEEAQVKIPRGTLLSDSNQNQWIIGFFVDTDGSSEYYKGAQYHGKVPKHYPVLIKLKPHGDKALCSEIDFFQQHANSKEIAKWLASKDVHYEYLGLPYYLGSAQNVTIAGATLDFLVLDQCGPNLETILAKHANVIPKPTVLKLAYHILGVLEYLHKRGIIYGNIRACNIRIDLRDNYVIYLLPRFHAMDESDDNAMMFWSERQHCGVTTKRGDIESLLYNMIYWSGGILPWRNAPPDEVKDMKIKAFKDPERFLQDAFPSCECENPSDCLAARKCVASGRLVAASECLQAIRDLMRQLASMDKALYAPDYKAIGKMLKKRLLNMYHVPTSKLQFVVPTLIGDEDHNGIFSRGERKKVTLYIPGLAVAANTLATIIAENCSSFDEVHAFDSQTGGVIEVLLQMDATKTRGVIRPIVQTAWKENTQKLRNMVVQLWRTKRLKPGSYKSWKKKNNEQEASINDSKVKRRTSTEAKKKAAEVANQKMLPPVQVDRADERSCEQPITLRDTNADATDGHLPSQRSKICPATESSLRERSFSPSRRRDILSNDLSEVPPKFHLSIPIPSPPSKSDRIYSPVSSASSSGFSSLRCDQVNFHLDDFSPLRMPEQSPETMYHQLPEEVVPERREETDKTNKRATEGWRSVPVVDEQWQDTYELLSTWLEDKEPTLAFGPIPSEPQLVAKQARRVRMLRDDFHMRDPQIRQLTSVLANLPLESTNAEKLRQIEQCWRDGLSLLEGRGKQLGDTSISQLRHVLQLVSNSLNQLPIEKDKLLCELESLVGKLQSQLANTETVVKQLTEVLIDDNLHDEFQALNKLHDDLQRKIQVEKTGAERSIRDGRQFDNLRQEIFVWLVKENEGISKNPLVSTDRATLQKQYKHYKSIFQRIMDREVEVMTLLEKGDVLSRPPTLENASIQQRTLDAVRSQWNLLKKQIVEINNKLQSCVEYCNKYYEARSLFLEWLTEAERKPIVLNDIQKQLEELTVFNSEVREKSDMFERIIKLGDTFVAACDNDENDEVKNELIAIKDQWNKLNSGLLKRTQSLEDMGRRFSGLKENLNQVKLCMDDLVSHDALIGSARDPNFFHRLKEARGKYSSLRSSLAAICQLANELVPIANEQRIDINNLRNEMKYVTTRVTSLNDQFKKRCDEFLEVTSFKKELEEPIPSVATEQKEDVKQMVSLTQNTYSSGKVIILVSSSDDEDFASDESKVDGLKQQSHKQSLEKKDATKLSRQNLNRLGSTTSDCEPGSYEKNENKKDSKKRKKASDPDWNSLSDTDEINSNVANSPLFDFKKKFKGQKRSSN